MWLKTITPLTLFATVFAAGLGGCDRESHMEFSDAGHHAGRTTTPPVAAGYQDARDHSEKDHAENLR